MIHRIGLSCSWHSGIRGGRCQRALCPRWHLVDSAAAGIAACATASAVKMVESLLILAAIR